jgi:hypothetical protein
MIAAIRRRIDPIRAIVRAFSSSWIPVVVMTRSLSYPVPNLRAADRLDGAADRPLTVR